MGSRLKENPDRTFYWFFEASCPIAKDKDPGVLFQFPEDFSDEESLRNLPRFCFPYDIERVRETVAVQHFTFALTDLEGCQRFGFCRLTSSSQTCLCILSYLPWFEVFYKLLNNLADCLTKGQMNEMRELLSTLYEHPVPLADSLVTLQLIPYFVAPDPRSLPSIPESEPDGSWSWPVDVGNLLQLYASMMFERRILVSSRKLGTLTACVHACGGILYPMYWQHIFIPVLPPHLLDYCCAPMPYLIGVHSSLIEKVRSHALEDVVVLNVDTNTVETPFEDLKKIPSDVVAALKVRLKKQSASPGPGVSRAFLRAQALLFGGYREALTYPADGPVFFSDESFLIHKSHSMRRFLESAVHLQFFKQFIDGRLEHLNRGEELADLFEEEILQCGASLAESHKSYQQWVDNLKKGGGALLLTVKSKAHVYKGGKCYNRLGLKDVLSAKEQHEAISIQRGGSVTGKHRRAQSDCLQSRLPITPHFGRSRPRRPTRKWPSRHGEDGEQETSWRPDWEDGDVGNSVQVPVTDLVVQLDPAEEPDALLLPDPEEMDLLGEIFDTLSSQTSREHGLLYATRSLDLFGPDSADFITRSTLAAQESHESLTLSMSGSLRSWEEGPEGLVEERDGAGDRPESPGAEGSGQTGELSSWRHTGEDPTKDSDSDLHAQVKKMGLEETEERLDTETSVDDAGGNEVQEEQVKHNEDGLELGSPASRPSEKESNLLKTPETSPVPTTLSTSVTEENKKAEERDRSASSPRVMSAVARFQVRDFQTKSSPDAGNVPCRAAAQAACNAISSASPLNADHDEDPPPVKVSELKKRFEG
ncbi:DENN domain-containing protein 1B-like [Denticeps clupeoides]|uniref:DENN domain-containing protein 1B-like n=1 Tax=Denticeps clupeoides TaxID=299321 RepID=UPI0010A2B875|nr:DENN domain-containing protein 1B-like [Denticeps clupeoides]